MADWAGDCWQVSISIVLRGSHNSPKCMFHWSKLSLWYPICLCHQRRPQNIVTMVLWGEKSSSLGWCWWRVHTGRHDKQEVHITLQHPSLLVRKNPNAANGSCSCKNSVCFGCQRAILESTGPLHLKTWWRGSSKSWSLQVLWSSLYKLRNKGTECSYIIVLIGIPNPLIPLNISSKGNSPNWATLIYALQALLANTAKLSAQMAWCFQSSKV